MKTDLEIRQPCTHSLQLTMQSLMQDFIARTSRWRTALLFAGSLVFVAIGVWMTGLAGPVPVSRRAGPLVTEFWGWVIIAFSGFCAFGCGKLWWLNNERLRIGPSGIRWAGWCDQTIPWDEISDISEWSYKGTKSIILQLRDPSRFPRRGLSAISGRANRTLTGGDIGITLSGTDRTFDEAMLAIRRFRQGL